MFDGNELCIKYMICDSLLCILNYEIKKYNPDLRILLIQGEIQDLSAGGSFCKLFN